MISTVVSMTVEAASALADVPAGKHEIVDIFGGHFGSDARTAGCQGHHQVIEPHDAGSDDHQRRDEDTAHHGDDDEDIGLPFRDTVDPRGFPYFVIDATQPGQHQSHDKSGTLPDAGNQQGENDRVPVGDQVESKALPAEIAHGLLQAKRRVEDPLPNQARDDEGEREGVEVDGSKRVLEPDFLVHEGRQDEPDDQGKTERDDAINRNVLNRLVPARCVEQTLVLGKADKLVDRQCARCGK